MRLVADSSRVYYGWYVAVAVGATAFVAWGIGFYQLGVFVQALHEQNGWSLAALSAGATLFYMLVGLTNLLAGRLVDRYGPRSVLLSGSIILGIGMFALGQVRSLWQVYVADAVLAIGFACTSTLVLGSVVGRWFHRRRAFVMTLALSGAPLGALVLVPVSSMLLERYGTSTASSVLAVIALTIALPMATLVIRDDPGQYGWERDGGRARPESSLPAGELTWTARSAIQTPVWWLLTFSFSAIMLEQVAYLVHQMSFLSPIVGSGRAAGIVSITGAFGLLGRFVGGLGDRFPKHFVMAGYCLIQALAVLLSAVTVHPLPLTVSAAIVGFTMGNIVALQPVLMAERFGMRSYGAVFGVASLLIQFGAALGLSLVGILADQTGDYTIPFLVTSVLGLLAASAAAASGWQSLPYARQDTRLSLPRRSDEG